MTTDTKQPPEGRFMVTVNGREVAAGVDVLIHFKDHQSRPVTQVGLFSKDGRPWVGYDQRELLYPVIDWREMPSWDRLAILDRYDEERKKLESNIAGFKTAAEMWHREYRDTLKALGEATAEAEENIGLRNERQQEVERLDGCVDTLRSQVTALTEERDSLRSEFKALTEEQEISNEVIENMKRHVDQLMARADRAEKERDEARASVDEWSGRARQAEQELVDERTAQHEACRMMREVASVLGPQGVHTPFIQQVKNLCDAHLLTTTAGWPLKVRIVIEERDRAIAERDEAREAWGRAESDACEWEEKAGVASADLATFTEKLHKAIAERDEALKRNRLGLSAYETVGDCSDWVEAVATGIGIYYEYEGPFVAAEARHVVDTIKRERAEHERLLLDAYLARDNAEAERDDLGCQLEALRAVQRDDMQVLLGRVAVLEKWRSWVMGDDQDEEHPHCASPEEWDRIRQRRCAESDHEQIKADEADDDDGGA